MIDFINRLPGNLIEYIPLQQGLRLIYNEHFHIVVFLIEYIPLQQGLRPFKKVIG